MRWNKTKKTVIGVAVSLATAALIAVFCSPATARVQGVCSNCHTMHDSQGGTAMASVGPHATLLMNSCVGCHSSGDSSTTYALGGSNVPVVNYTSGSEPTDYLAGGNFYWVADNGGNNDTKGHNVFGIAGQDANISTFEGAPGRDSGCSNSCHRTLAEEQDKISDLGSGCEGCHLYVRHHADDSDVVVGFTGGWYRFLSGHDGNDPTDVDGVIGIEDNNWQATKSSADHNEYLGNIDGYDDSGSGLNKNNTTTAYCCGCHGNFHVQQDSGAWIRHPSDAVIPATGEYQYAFASEGGGATGTYDPLAPVARPNFTGFTGPKDSVAIGTDMVMCLSCHRPHGSPYDDMLRWDYNGMIAGGGDNASGCFACHTKKDTGG